MVDTSELIEAAKQARVRAYAPYSGFRMGAAVLTAEGTVMPGSLVENVVPWPRNVCGTGCLVRLRRRRPAPHRAGLGFTPHRRCGDAPCGACLQVALELGGPTLEVVAAATDGEVVRHRLGELLPLGPRLLSS